MVQYRLFVVLPFREWRKLIVGSVLYMIPFIGLITGLFANGYGIAFARNVMQGRVDLPEWTQWKSLFIDGLLMTLITCIWLIPAAIVSSLILGSLTFSILAGEYVRVGPWASIVLVCILIVGYIIPAALMNYVNHARFLAGFDVRTIWNAILTPMYARTWLIVLLMYIVLSGIFAVLGALFAIFGVIGTILTFILMGFMTFISLILGLGVYADAWSSIRYSPRVLANMYRAKSTISTQTTTRSRAPVRRK